MSRSPSASEGQPPIRQLVTKGNEMTRIKAIHIKNPGNIGWTACGVRWAGCFTEVTLTSGQATCRNCTGTRQFKNLVLREIGAEHKTPKRKPKSDNAAATPQPPPKTNGSRPIVDLVVEDLQARKEFGLRKYGTPLQAHNGRDALMDLFQELLDAVLYCKQLIVERDTHNKTETTTDTFSAEDYQNKLLLLKNTMNPVIRSLLTTGSYDRDDCVLFSTKPDISTALKVPNDEPTSERLECMAADWACRVVVPMALDAAGFEDQAASLRALKPVVDKPTAQAAMTACIDVSSSSAKVHTNAHKTAYYAAHAAVHVVNKDTWGSINPAFYATVSANLAIQTGASKTLIQDSLMDLFCRMCKTAD